MVMKDNKKSNEPERKKKLSEFAGTMAGPEYADFAKAALEVRHIGAAKTREEKEIIEAAIAFIDQLNTFNDFNHPEVHRRARELQKAVSEYWIAHNKNL